LKGSNKETKNVETVALAAPTGASRDNRFRNNYPNQSQTYGMEQKKELFCRYCKKDNHVIEDCLRLKYKRKNERNTYNPGSSGHNFAGSSMTGQAGAENAQGEAKAVDGASNLRLSPEDCTRLMALLQQSNFTASSASPSQHQANTAATHLSYFAGPSNSEDDWFCKRS
ncbi:hypothetical protein LINPERHAP2_LOCUS10780, partial [Linum perenne]